MQLVKLFSVTRTQLNINISPELLKALKKTARRSGLTMTEFVAKALATSIDAIEDQTYEERLSKIEQKIQILLDKESKALPIDKA